MMRVAVFGASGFVGTAFTERAHHAKAIDVLAICRSVRSTARLASLGIPFHVFDLLDRKMVSAALKDCTHVVNCSRGEDAVMIDGLRNLLEVSMETGIRRFVHLSSVAVYGDPPFADAAHETGTTKPDAGSYGEQKLQQDEMVEAARRRGLSTVILCPPNISGIGSAYVSAVLEEIRTGSLKKVDDGSWPINLVDVENLAYAIELALKVDNSDGKRIFITDGGQPTWGEFIDGLAQLLPDPVTLETISADELRAELGSGRKSGAPRAATIRGVISHLLSGEMRVKLSEDPLLKQLIAGVEGFVQRRLPGVEQRLRRGFTKPIQIAKVPSRRSAGSRYNGQQLRGVAHRIDRAKQVLGYEPLFDMQGSMTRYRSWYRALIGDHLGISRHSHDLTVALAQILARGR